MVEGKAGSKRNGGNNEKILIRFLLLLRRSGRQNMDDGGPRSRQLTR